MPTLLSLPREIRDEILTLILLAQETNPAPNLKQFFSDFCTPRTRYKQPLLKAWSTLVLYDPSAKISNAVALCLVNHQLHHEVQDLIQHIANIQKPSYNVDITILDEIVPIVTWTHIPFLSHSIQDLNATFRISGFFDALEAKDALSLRKRKAQDPSFNPHTPGPYSLLEVGQWKGFRSGCGAGPAMGWQIYAILERLIRVGPVGERGGDAPSTIGLDAEQLQILKEQPHRHITIQNLNINVETPEGVPKECFTLPLSVHAYGNSVLAEPSAPGLPPPRSVLDPRHLARFIMSSMESLASGRAGTEWFEYGKLLYEHVGHISVSLDGVEICKIDVGERLRNVEYIDHHCWKRTTEEAVTTYQAQAVRVRTERGLERGSKKRAPGYEAGEEEWQQRREELLDALSEDDE